MYTHAFELIIYECAAVFYNVYSVIKFSLNFLKPSLEFGRYLSWKSIGIPVVFHWNSNEMPLFYSSGMPPVFHQNATSISVECHKYSSKMPLVSSGMPLVFQWNTTSIPVECHWFSDGIPLVFQRIATGISVECQWKYSIFQWNSSEMPLFYSSGIPLEFR